MKKKSGVFDFVNVLMMIGLMAITLYPFWYMISVSLSGDYFLIRNEVTLWPKGFTTQWYEMVINDGRIIKGYRNTIMYTVLGTSIALSITSMAAFALSQKKMMYRKQIMMLIIFTILFSGGMIPMFLVAKYVGILDSIWAMVLPGAVSTFHLLVFRTFFQQLPEEIFDSGRIDGLKDIGLFFRIVLPLSKPVFAAIALFEAVAMWNNFFKPILYLRTPDLFPLSMVLRELVIEGMLEKELAGQANAGGDVVQSNGLKFATVVFSTLPILLLYPFLQKYFVKGMLLGSVKG